MKLNPAFFSTLLIVISIQLTMSVAAQAAQEEKPERWFEIEVILFKQLNNKAALKEQFPDNITATNLPKYKQSFDLLNPYLQPNLTRIKQFVPLCGEKDAQQLFLESLQSVSTPFPEQMALIEQVAMFELPNFTEDLIVNEETIASKKTITNEESSAIDESIKETEQTLIDENNTDDSEQTTPHETEQIAALAFEFDFQEEALAKPIFSTQNLCIISQSDIDAIFDKEQLAGFNLDSFGVDHIPSKLNASGAHVSDSPYLIADQSLLLKDISQRLRWSKEFKPLLHFGWRQIGITQKKAIPLKLFAGKHLGYQYQQALTAYQTEVEAAKATEQNLLKQRIQSQSTDQDITQDRDQLAVQTSFQDIDENNVDLIENRQQLIIEHKQQTLNALFARLDNIDNIYNTDNNQFNNNIVDDNTLDDAIEPIEKQTLENILATNNVATAQDEQLLELISPPKEPLQSWFLEGFLKIHLDHYLYISADFNVFNKNQVKLPSEADSSDNKANAIKLVNFSQTRRVISGEIHYFDHPNIGMIIQIRRFDPNKSADEAVTQAIK